MSFLKRKVKKIINHFGFDIVLYPAIPMDVRRMKVLTYLSFLFTKIEAVPGNIVECGVGKGRSILAFAFLSNIEEKNRKVWGFDSFEGFPEPTKEDRSDRDPKKGDWSGTNIKDILAILSNAGLPIDFIKNNIFLVKGFFNNTMNQYDGSPIAFLHVDADLYESYEVVLRNFYPLVSKGGIVLFDEYNQSRWPGAKQAVDEFLSNNPHTLHKIDFADKYYIIKK